ncbi:hypothetical protein CBL_10665 [Carabus blaptoides fortunei]
MASLPSIRGHTGVRRGEPCRGPVSVVRVVRDYASGCVPPMLYLGDDVEEDARHVPRRPKLRAINIIIVTVMLEFHGREAPRSETR